MPCESNVFQLLFSDLPLLGNEFARVGSRLGSFAQRTFFSSQLMKYFAIPALFFSDII